MQQNETETTPSEFWASIAEARKHHAFGADGRSLCGKYMAHINADHPAATRITPADTKQDSDCAACWRRLPQLLDRYDG